MLTRRTLLLTALTLLPAKTLFAAVAPSQLRIVSLDLAITESLLGLGVIPLAVANKRWYENFIVNPPLPGFVREIGLPDEPNLELLEMLKPDLICATRSQMQVNTRLQHVAPVVTMDIFQPDSSPWLLAQQMITQLGVFASRRERAEKLVQEASDQLHNVGVRLQKFRTRPLFLARINEDGRHLLLFGRHGMYDDLLQRMGFHNAYEGKTNAWGGAIVGLDHLLSQPEARLVFFSNRGDRHTVEALLSSPLWKSIPLIREGRYSAINRLYPSGGLLSAMHFLRELETAMPGQTV
ncbi:periplasmic substrate-binding component of an ABC superfamily ferric hydroxamate transporter [Rahnella aquatilis CIP 78.65 = ATCC 33071]|uniref:ABC-type Fe3+-hydroxamate transport system, periplasmic component n=1 Tax=Rahnella aquatilis (strain ATCC 33071 / DSM 4594 / JCM 1683 / NBRC 105701 / NCIMB 13365 / CIP 78.65) TaxID=745277 RepID=H2IW89_RAHAC|nr:ABC transporter substrate-binding protein [Rahnella aquatilis]AEX51821.1 ABC-type Fe3+-hydroxamate transport system, periplasmic component [Rahnella aquatilis CIP 78.65 = ATCC 33071]KFD15620.1 periplasmic substrate-binding component of an ABC superfamily ferric hydroxamate transporter [Rahnella aquatilis CIP 78.65 = ATCC 33071]